MLSTKKRNSVVMHIKMFVAILVLVGLTYFALEFPSMYYKREDNRLDSRTNSVQVLHGDYVQLLDETRIPEAMFSQDTVFIDTTTNASFYSCISRQSLEHIVHQFDGCTYEAWEKYLEYVLLQEESNKKYLSIKMSRIIDDTIYSTDIGVILFSDMSLSFDGLIMFDKASEKLLGITVMLDIPVDVAVKEIEIGDGSVLMEYWSDPQEYYNGNYPVYELNYEAMRQGFILPEYDGDWISEYCYAQSDYLNISPFDAMNIEFKEVSADEYWYDSDDLISLDVDGTSIGYLDWDYNPVMESIRMIIQQHTDKVW